MILLMTLMNSVIWEAIIRTMTDSKTDSRFKNRSSTAEWWQKSALRESSSCTYSGNIKVTSFSPESPIWTVLSCLMIIIGMKINPSGYLTLSVAYSKVWINRAVDLCLHSLAWIALSWTMKDFNITVQISKSFTFLLLNIFLLDSMHRMWFILSGSPEALLSHEKERERDSCMKLSFPAIIICPFLSLSFSHKHGSRWKGCEENGWRYILLQKERNTRERRIGTREWKWRKKKCESVFSFLSDSLISIHFGIVSFRRIERVTGTRDILFFCSNLRTR